MNLTELINHHLLNPEQSKYFTVFSTSQYNAIIVFFHKCQFDNTILPFHRGGAVVEALRYKPKGHGIDSRWCH
jgi:hypothetical protein